MMAPMTIPAQVIAPVSRYSINSQTELQVSAYPYKVWHANFLDGYVSDNPHHRRVINDVLSLRVAEEGELQVSDHAVIQALALTPGIFFFMQANPKGPRIVDDGASGIRMTWRLGKRELRAVLPAVSTGRRYLYWEEGNRYSRIQNFTDVTLFERLSWLHQTRAC